MFMYVKFPTHEEGLSKYLEIVATSASDTVHCLTEANMAESFASTVVVSSLAARGQ